MAWVVFKQWVHKTQHGHTTCGAGADCAGGARVALVKKSVRS